MTLQSIERVAVVLVTLWLMQDHYAPGFLEQVLAQCDEYLDEYDPQGNKVPTDDLGVLLMRTMRKWVQGRIMDRDWES